MSCRLRTTASPNFTTYSPRPAVDGRSGPDTAGHPRQQPLTTFVQVRGCFGRWWQVLGSNQRRLSRRFYRPLPLAARATCRAPPYRTAAPPYRTAAPPYRTAQCRIAESPPVGIFGSHITAARPRPNGTGTHAATRPAPATPTNLYPGTQPGPPKRGEGGPYRRQTTRGHPWPTHPSTS